MTIREKYAKQREENKDKRLVLLGTAISCFETDWELDEYWACGSAFGKAHESIKRIDRGFEIHNMDLILKISEERCVDYNKYDCPIFVQDENNIITKQLIDKPETFPLDDMLKYVDENNKSKYFTSSFCYMIVYAAMMGYKDITLSKILLNADGEYFMERPGVEYWIDTLGVREGIEFHVPEDCEIFSNVALYGYEDRPNIWKMQSRQKYLWEAFVKHYLQNIQLTDLLARATGILYMHDLMKKGQITPDEINKLLAECNNAIKMNSDKLASSKEYYMQFMGSLQAMEFVMRRG
jgi:hypothetical protein